MTRTSNGPEPTTGHDCRLDRLCPIHRAAPELLRVAKEIVAAYSFVASTTVDTLIEDDLQAAIAKAETPDAC